MPRGWSFHWRTRKGGLVWPLYENKIWDLQSFYLIKCTLLFSTKSALLLFSNFALEKHVQWLAIFAQHGYHDRQWSNKIGISRWISGLWFVHAAGYVVVNVRIKWDKIRLADLTDYSFQRQVFSCISSRILCCTFQKFQDCHDDHHKIHVDIVLLKNIRFHSKTFKSSAETGFPYMPGSYLDQDKRMIYPPWYFFMEMPETLVFVFQMRYRCFRI